VRALRIRSDADPPQAPTSDALRRWTIARREMLLNERLDRLTVALERLVTILERRAA